jgi:bacteriocin biosynthesis cyclodehydratase domain-containing protein
MRPALRPGLLPVWRDKDTVQIGVDPRRAVAISGMRAAAEVIRLLDGSRDRQQLVAEASGRGIPAAVTERVLTLLAATGVLIDHPAAILRSLPPELRQRLLPEMTAISLTSLDGDGGAGQLTRRAATTVQVLGRGPTAGAIADLLTSSGVAAQAIPEPASGWPGTGSPPRGAGQPGDSPDLVVLASPPAPELLAGLHRAGLPHLPVSAAEAIGTVGPLVLPGRTACLRCLDLARTDRDPAWPLVLAQATGRVAEAPSAVLSAAVAAQAAAQALAFADRMPPEATVNGTLELVLPAWQWRRRSWLPHPACVCAAHPNRAASAG